MLHLMKDVSSAEQCLSVVQWDKLQVRDDHEVFNFIAFNVLNTVLSACVLGGPLPVLCEEGRMAHPVAWKLHKELVTGLAISHCNPSTIQFQVSSSSNFVIHS